MSVRRVRRIIRKFDPWSVLKVALVLNTVAAMVWVLGVWVSWSIAVQRGIPEAFVELLARLTIAVTPDGDLYFRVIIMSAVVWVVVATAAMTLGAVLYNLISDVVGGVEMIMLEEVPDVPQMSETQRPRPVVHVPPNGSTSSTLNNEVTVEQSSTA
ncbi:MAG: DUF3566 domain-containing protein [Acidimicrobiia bacterium]